MYKLYIMQCVSRLSAQTLRMISCQLFEYKIYFMFCVYARTFKDSFNYFIFVWYISNCYFNEKSISLWKLSAFPTPILISHVIFSDFRTCLNLKLNDFDIIIMPLRIHFTQNRIFITFANTRSLCTLYNTLHKTRRLQSNIWVVCPYIRIIFLLHNIQHINLVSTTLGMYNVCRCFYYVSQWPILFLILFLLWLKS